MTHFDEIDVGALADTWTNGNGSDVAAVIRSSDNPAHTALKLLRRMATDDDVAVDRDTDSGKMFHRLSRLLALVEYNCISHDEDVIAELRAGDIDGALRIMGVES